MSPNRIKWRRQQKPAKKELEYRELVQWASDRGLYRFGMSKKDLEALYHG